MQGTLPLLSRLRRLDCVRTLSVPPGNRSRATVMLITLLPHTIRKGAIILDGFCGRTSHLGGRAHPGKLNTLRGAAPARSDMYDRVAAVDP